MSRVTPIGSGIASSLSMEDSRMMWMSPSCIRWAEMEQIGKFQFLEGVHIKMLNGNTDLDQQMEPITLSDAGWSPLTPEIAGTAACQLGSDGAYYNKPCSSFSGIYY